MMGWQALSGDKEKTEALDGPLQKALIYLGTRARRLTPLGAAEYLMVSPTHGDAYEKRVRLALEVCTLYRERFPEEYSRSAAPPFSTAREHEFYRLVDGRLFPLRMHEVFSLDLLLRREPNHFFPFIPVKGTQRHTWAGGCFDFQEIEPSFKLAQVLSYYTGAGGRGWNALKWLYGLRGIPEPAPPLAAVGWSLFAYSCAVEGSPLAHLPLAFKMISYKTGNVWLDLPPVGYVGWEWSDEKLTELAVCWRLAGDLTDSLRELDAFIAEDPQARIARAVELWNKAAEVERQTGHAGEYTPDGFLGAMPADVTAEVLRDVYGDDVPLHGDVAAQYAALTGAAFGEPRPLATVRYLPE